MSLRVKQEPGPAATDRGEPVLVIKDEAGWSVGEGQQLRGVLQEPVELGHYLPFDGNNTLLECVKTEPSCSASKWADLYAEHAVKDGLVLGPECVQRPRARDVPGECVKMEPSCLDLYAEHAVKDELVLGPECVQRSRARDVPGECFYPREASAESVRAPRSQRALIGCPVRLERGPHRRVLPPRTRTRTRTRTRGSDRGAPMTRAHGDSDIEHELYTTIDYDKDPTCDMCGRRFAVKADLMRHVVVHIHTPAGTELDEGIGGDQISDEEIDVVSLDPWPLPLAAARARADSLARGQRARRPAARARAGRGRRPNTDTDSEAEDPTKKRRRRCTYKCAKERIRRSGLKNLFNDLRKQLPVTIGKENAPKVVILRGAVALCRRLREKEIYREGIKKKLLTKSKKLRAMVALLHRPC